MKLGKKISFKSFIFTQLLILLIGLTLVGVLYYILNIQYQKKVNPFQNPVTSLPRSLKLDLDQPDDNSLTFQSTILVTGQTSPLKDVLIFTDSKDLVITSKKDGSFSTEINLDEGVNQVSAVVFEPNGNSKSATRTVYFSNERI